MSKLKNGVAGLFLLVVLVTMTRHSSADDPLCTDIETTCVTWGPANPSYPGYCCQQNFPYPRTVPAPEGVTANKLPGTATQCGTLKQVEAGPLGDPICGDEIQLFACGGQEHALVFCTPH